MVLTPSSSPPLRSPSLAPSLSHCLCLFPVSLSLFVFLCLSFFPSFCLCLSLSLLSLSLFHSMSLSLSLSVSLCFCLSVCLSVCLLFWLSFSAMLPYASSLPPIFFFPTLSLSWSSAIIAWPVWRNCAHVLCSVQAPQHPVLPVQSRTGWSHFSRRDQWREADRHAASDQTVSAGFGNTRRVAEDGNSHEAFVTNTAFQGRVLTFDCQWFCYLSSLCP